eukprot:c13083_g2_i5.p2 GENE.c13083_g2_i5~~c13083_g2_i5.p2  ORF type:complete len:106 (+),score=16.99 c13083_g2_i5:296-613(+)
MGGRRRCAETKHTMNRGSRRGEVLDIESKSEDEENRAIAEVGEPLQVWVAPFATLVVRTLFTCGISCIEHFPSPENFETTGRKVETTLIFACQCMFIIGAAWPVA